MDARGTKIRELTMEK